MARGRRPRFGVFAEGSQPTDPNRSTFESLWRELCQACGCKDDIRVYGFSKKQIILLKDEPHAPRRGWSDEPLDILIERMQRQDGFENVLIAFDRWPPNEEIQSKPFCLRTEVNFILEALLRRRVLPEHLLSAASALLEGYTRSPREPRTRGRPPFGPLKFLFMDPMFEGLLVHDESVVLRALELERRPKDWPRFNPRTRQPDQHILAHAVERAAHHRKAGLPSFTTDKHGWALKIVRAAHADSRFWEHPIAERLRTLLA